MIVLCLSHITQGWPPEMQDRARVFMQGILTSLPGSPAVCSLNCISRPAFNIANVPQIPPRGSRLAKGSQAICKSSDYQLKTPAPPAHQPACSPASCSPEPPSPSLDTRPSHQSDHWLVISRLEVGQPPIVMQIPVDGCSSPGTHLELLPQASSSKVIFKVSMAAMPCELMCCSYQACQHVRNGSSLHLFQGAAQEANKSHLLNL